MIDLCRFIPCFLAFFYLLISLGQQGLIILRLKGGFTLGHIARMQLFNQSGGAIQKVVVVAFKEWSMKLGALAASIDLFCFARGRLLPERYSLYDL